jgi:putative ATP-binding cassette transporter
MKPLSISLVLFGLLALVQPAHQLDLPGALLGIVVLLCAATTFRSGGISSFLKIFVGIFSTETIVFGLAVLAGRAGLWPANYAEYLPPESLPLTVAIFSIIVYVVARFHTVGQIMRIADRYFLRETADVRGIPVISTNTRAMPMKSIACASGPFVHLQRLNVGSVWRWSFSSC